MKTKEIIVDGVKKDIDLYDEKDMEDDEILLEDINLENTIDLSKIINEDLTNKGDQND